MASNAVAGALSTAWDGTTPAAAPAGSVVQFSVQEYSSAGFEVWGTFVGTVVLEVLIGHTWVTPNVFTLARAAGLTSFTAAGLGLIQLAGITAVRARMSAFTSGVANVVFNGSLAPV